MHHAIHIIFKLGSFFGEKKIPISPSEKQIYQAKGEEFISVPSVTTLWFSKLLF